MRPSGITYEVAKSWQALFPENDVWVEKPLQIGDAPFFVVHTLSSSYDKEIKRTSWYTLNYVIKYESDSENITSEVDSIRDAILDFSGVVADIIRVGKIDVETLEHGATIMFSIRAQYLEVPDGPLMQELEVRAKYGYKIKTDGGIEY